MGLFTTRFDSNLTTAPRPVTQRILKEIVHYPAEQYPVTPDDRQVRHNDTGITSADVTREQLSALVDELLNAYGSPLERFARGARLMEQGLHEDAHSSECANQVLELAARGAFDSIVELLFEHLRVALGGDERRHQFVRGDPGVHLQRCSLTLDVELFALEFDEGRTRVLPAPVQLLITAPEPSRAATLSLCTTRSLHFLPPP